MIPSRSLVKRGVLEKARPGESTTGDMDERARLEQGDAFAELKKMSQSVNRRQNVSNEPWQPPTCLRDPTFLRNGSLGPPRGSPRPLGMPIGGEEPMC